jgi:hypothetical protein
MLGSSHLLAWVIQLCSGTSSCDRSVQELMNLAKSGNYSKRPVVSGKARWYVANVIRFRGNCHRDQ